MYELQAAKAAMAEHGIPQDKHNDLAFAHLIHKGCPPDFAQGILQGMKSHNLSAEIMESGISPLSVDGGDAYIAWRENGESAAEKYAHDALANWQKYESTKDKNSAWLSTT